MFLGDVYVRRKLTSLPGLSESQRHIFARASQYSLATHYRRFAAYQGRMVRRNLWRGHLLGAALAFWRMAIAYVKYLRLRHNDHSLSDLQVNALLNSRALLDTDRAFFE